MGKISESVSEMRRRGRPRLLPEALVEGMRRIEPGITTMRGLQNMHYQGRAHQLITGALQDTPALRWLIDPERAKRGELGAYRKTILQALGRLEGDADLLAVARVICDRKPSTREVLRLIRYVRFGHQPEGSTADLADRLIALLNNYLHQHEGVDRAMLLEALARTTRAVRKSLA